MGQPVKFIPNMNRGGSAPSIRIGMDGVIKFNAVAAREFGIKDGYCILYYDRENNCILIQTSHDGPILPSDEGAVRLIYKKGQATINGWSFFRAFGISVLNMLTLTPVFDDKLNMIRIPLKGEER